ncbi:MAG TPA: NAD-binding protein, partial [Flavobacteriales bacterium]|nr:NAD-binding protein [Flavobacteriales bacterium]
GLQLGLLSEQNYQRFLAVAILGMGATPFLLANSDRIVRKVFLSFMSGQVTERLDRMMRVKREQEKTMSRVLKDHVVIVGFGLNGQNVASAAIESGIRCAVIEEDPDLAHKAQLLGLTVLVGDGSNIHMLEQAQAQSARVVVVAISDAPQTLKIVAAARSLSSTAHIIVRTRYVREIEANFQAGANEVIPEEFETSIEIFHRVLRKYLLPEARIQELVASIRSDHYGRLRGTAGNKLRKKEGTLAIPGLEIATMHVTLGRSKVVGRTIAEIALREHYGITVLAIRRGGRYITNVSGNARIMTDDLLYLLGAPEDIVKLDQELR